MYSEKEIEQYEAYLGYARRSIWKETLLHKMGVPLDKIELPLIEKGKRWVFHWKVLMGNGQTPLKGSMRLFSFSDFLDIISKEK